MSRLVTMLVFTGAVMLSVAATDARAQDSRKTFHGCLRFGAIYPVVVAPAPPPPCVGGTVVTWNEPAAPTAVAPNSIDDVHVVDDGLDASSLATGSVGTDEIQDRSVSQNDLAFGAVTNTEIRDGTVTRDELARDSVGTDKILDRTITADDIADNAVDRGHLANDAVDTPEIMDRAVTTDKLQANVGWAFDGGVASLPSDAENLGVLGATVMVNSAAHRVVITGQAQLDCSCPPNGNPVALSWQIRRGDGVPVGHVYKAVLSMSHRLQVITVNHVDVVDAGTHTYSIAVKLTVPNGEHASLTYDGGVIIAFDAGR